MSAPDLHAQPAPASDATAAAAAHHADARKAKPRPPLPALLLSLLIHALLLSLSFGGNELGLPGLSLPWKDRRVEVPELRAVILPTPAAARAGARASGE